MILLASGCCPTVKVPKSIWFVPSTVSITGLFVAGSIASSGLLSTSDGSLTSGSFGVSANPSSACAVTTRSASKEAVAPSSVVYVIVSLYSPDAVPTLGITHTVWDSPGSSVARSCTIKCSGLISWKVKVPVPVFLMVTSLASGFSNPSSRLPKSSAALPSSITASAV